MLEHTIAGTIMHTFTYACARVILSNIYTVTVTHVYYYNICIGSMANPFVNGGGGGGGMNRGMNPNSITKPGMMIDKRARTVYVGNVQPSILEHDLRSFFLSSLPTVRWRVCV